MTGDEKARLRADIREILEIHYGSIENISYDDREFILDAVRCALYMKSRPAQTKNLVKHIAWKIGL